MGTHENFEAVSAPSPGKPSASGRTYLFKKQEEPTHPGQPLHPKAPPQAQEIIATALFWPSQLYTLHAGNQACKK